MSAQEVGRNWHREAMGLMDEHDRLKRVGKDAEARLVALDALQLEKRALTGPLLEPFRSFVYRSAASIALDAGRVNEALSLVSDAGDEVPEPISFQLKEIARIARERAQVRDARANDSTTEAAQASRTRVVTVSSREEIPLILPLCALAKR